MPVYEYVCDGCQHAFEELVLGQERPTCPRCGGTELQKQHSVFAAHGERAPAPEQGPCGNCNDPRGPENCPFN